MGRSSLELEPLQKFYLQPLCLVYMILETTDEDGILPPMLDTGATHSLLRLKMDDPQVASRDTQEDSFEGGKRSGVRALLHENVNYCSTVSYDAVPGLVGCFFT